MASRLALLGGSALRGGRAFPAWPNFGTSEQDALARTLESGVWGIGSGEIERFERAFADYQGCRGAIAMANGSVTLRNALLACGLEAGDEVIVPPYTFLATITSVIEANGVPVFVDIDPATYCLDPDLIEAAITPRTRVIMPVHLAGNMAAMDRIVDLARRRGLKVIEDSAHAVGAEFKGRRAGSLGDLGSFSFQSSKNLCCGEGGALVGSDEALLERCWSLHNCGRRQDGAWYEHPFLGGNYRLGAFAAALLNARLGRLDDEQALRHRNATRLIARLDGLPGVRPIPPSAGTTRHGWHLFPLRYDPDAHDGLPRRVWREALVAEGIPVEEGYTTPPYRHAFMRAKAFAAFDGWKNSRPGLDYGAVRCPVAERAAEVEGAWLPHYVLLGSEQDVDDIADALAKVHEHRRELLERGGNAS